MSETATHQIVAVTGGLGDIDKATCQVFARNGASVTVCDMRYREEAQAFIASLASESQWQCTYYQVDVGNPSFVGKWLAAVSTQLGTPNVMVANAAQVTIATALKITPLAWQQEININLNGAFYSVQESAQLMVEQGIVGRIVLIGSRAAHRVHTNMPACSVAKAALRMLCKCIALEQAPKGVLVNEVAPGYVQAGLTAKVWRERRDLCDQATIKAPVGEFITPEAVADEVFHLCRAENKHMTGTTVLMDGGCRYYEVIYEII